MKNTTLKNSNFGKNLKQWYLACMVLCLSVTGGLAQGTIPVGSGSSTNSDFPINSCMGYTYSQQIVSASEYSSGGGVAGNITKVRFYYTSGASAWTNSANWNVYIGHTAKTAFTSDSDWESTANLTQVFSGTIATPVSNSWVEITFTAPFAYNGTSNLIVAVDENQPSWNCTANWGSYTSTTNSGIRYISDGTNPDPASPPAGARYSTIARLQFVGQQASCLPPSGVISLSSSSASGTLNWTASASTPGEGYQYYYSTTNTVPTAGTLSMGSTGAGVTTATINGLSPNTTYYAWVRSNCGGGDLSSWASAPAFTTGQIPGSLPYLDGFEGTPQWTVLNGTQTNKWHIGTAVNNGGTNSLYISNDGGATNTYTLTSTSVVQAYRDITLPADIVEAKLSFDIRVPGEFSGSSLYDYVRIWVVPTSFVPTPGTQISSAADRVQIGGSILNFPNFTNLSYIIPATAYAGQTVRLVFEWRNDSSDGTQPPAAIDNINITPVTCFAPSALTATVVPGTVTLNWTAPGTVPGSGYDYYFSTTNVAPGATTPPVSGNVATGTTIALTTLTPDTVYYFWVRSNCGTEQSVWASGGSFRTDCDAVVPTGAYENFESYTGTMPDPACWREAKGILGATPALNMVGGNWTNQNYNNATGANGKAAYIELYGTDNDWIISPAINLGDGSVEYQVEYAASVIPWTGAGPVTDMGEKYVKVVVSTDGGATWAEANVIATYDNTNIPAGGVNEVIVLEGYTGVVKIGFYGFSTTTAQDLRFYIDNYRVRAVPSCENISGLEFSDVTEDTATILWDASPSAPAEGYEYYLGTSSTAPVEADNATGSVGPGVLEVGLSGLDTSTSYYVWVRGECEPGLYSEWVGPAMFSTPCDSADILTTVGDSVCGQGIAELSATVSTDGILTWYAAETGGAALGTGESFTTPYLYETTDFYVSGGNIADGTDVSVGAGASSGTALGTSPLYYNWGGIKTQYIVRAEELQAAGVSAGPINSVAFTVTTAGTTPYQNFSVSVGATAQDIATTTTISGLDEVYTSAAYLATMGQNVFAFDTPFVWDGTSNIVVQVCFNNGTSGDNSQSTSVQYDTVSPVSTTAVYADGQTGNVICENPTGSTGGSGGSNTYGPRAKMTFNATAICESPRVMVTAEVTDAPDIEVTESAAICAGESFDLSVTSANAGYTYVWMPGNLSGAEQTVTPAETTTYTVMATDEVTGCVESAEVTVTVNILPLPVVVTPAESDVCLNTVIALTATGGGSAAVVEYCSPTILQVGASADYLNNFSFANVTNNGSGDAASDYTYYSGLTANVVAGESYDVSMQGGSTQWAQQFRIWIDYNQDGVFSADESVFNTTTSSINEVTGSITIPATAYNGVTRMRVADRYSSSIPEDGSCYHNGFGEYEDYNVSITGATNPVDYVWSPEEGLFMDEAATMPYTGDPALTVYYYATDDAEFTATVTTEEGCTASASTELTVIIIPAPAATAAQTFCAGATVGDLATTDAEAVSHWYYSAVGGTALADTTPLLDGTPYFVSQTVDGCESVARTMVTATVNTVDAPEASEDVYTFCNAATLADIELDGENIMWYADAMGGEALASDMALEEGITLLFASQTVDGCESQMRAAVVVELNMTDAPMIMDDAPVFCNSATLADIMVEGENVMWYADEEGGEPLASDMAVENEGMYYASQTINGCESAARTMVMVSINAPEAPTGDDTQEFCYMGTVGDIVVDGSAGNWYDAAEDGNMLSMDTPLVSGTTYYASQFVDGCESISRFGVTVTIDMPMADAPENVTACFGYELPELNNGNYYTDSNGAGEMLPAGTIIVETTDLYVYYVSGGELGCTAENMFTVTINGAILQGDPIQTVEVNAEEAAVIADLILNGDGTITWYASEEAAALGQDPLEGGFEITDGATYWAVLTNGDCTSEPFGVTVDVVLGRDGFDSSAFTYYPNPVTDVLNMSYSEEISSVKVFNMLGQEVMSIQPNATEVKLNMASLSDATYIVNVTSGDSVKTVKVVKKQ